MVIITTIAPLDLWTLIVVFVAGSFWGAVILIELALYIILGVFGRCSRDTVIWYMLLFLLTATIGYGSILLSILVTLLIITYFYFSMQGYFEGGGQ